MTLVQARLTRRFSAPSEVIFDAWLEPDLIGRWMFGPDLRGEEVLRIRLEPRLGGTFSFLVRRQGQEIGPVGRYEEIAWPHELDPQRAEFAHCSEAAWSKMLEALAEALRGKR